MAEQVTQFKTHDGKFFDTQELADKHESRIALTAKIEDYIKAAGLEGAPAGVLRKHGLQLFDFVDENVTPSREVKKAKKPKAAPAEAKKA